MSDAGVRRALLLGCSGAALLMAGFAILMGIITAETQYPGDYRTAQSEISDLGATRPPDSVIVQPSAAIFNTSMVVAGVFLLVGTLGVFATWRDPVVSTVMLLMSLGVLGVGIFPGNHAVMHPIVALMSFAAGGVSAVATARIATGAFRYLAPALGVIALAALSLALFANRTPLFERLGDGGVERWIAYPIVLWMVALGGYVLGVSPREARGALGSAAGEEPTP